MRIESTDRKTFELSDGNQKLGQLRYNGLFSYQAELVLPDSESYEIKPSGFFGTSLDVFHKGSEVANMKMNWRGNIVISFKDGNEFVLRAIGALHNKYVLENTELERLMQFNPNFNWSKFTYHYEIGYDQKPSNPLLVLLGVYAANYYMAAMSGVIAGTA